MKVPKIQTGQDPRRRMPRHPTDVVHCPLGDLLDLSGTGMRLAIPGRCSLKPGQVLTLKLKTPHGAMPVAARVVWKKRKGLFKNFEVGLQFEGLKPSQVVALATIARFGFIAGGQVDAGTSQTQEKPAGGDPSAVEASLVLSEYYEKLGLTPGADASDIKHAYRKLARACHPDVAPGPENQKKFVELREAYDLLSDHLKRAG
jgi:hypothetical protein